MKKINGTDKFWIAWDETRSIAHFKFRGVFGTIDDNSKERSMHIGNFNFTNSLFRVAGRYSLLHYFGTVEFDKNGELSDNHIISGDAYSDALLSLAGVGRMRLGYELVTKQFVESMHD